MKQRQGFVSNSSSSSFIIKRCCLTSAQEALIENWSDIAQNINDSRYGTYDGSWGVEVYEDEYRLYTHIDNFNLRRFFGDLGIKCGREENW